MKRTILISFLFLSNILLAQPNKTDAKIINAYCKEVNGVFKGVSSNTKKIIINAAETGSDIETAFAQAYMADSATFLKDAAIITALPNSFEEIDKEMTSKYGRTMDQIYMENKEMVMTYLTSKGSACAMTKAMYIFAERPEEPIDPYYDYYEGE